ncbi:hypothetical protein LCGC14_0019150 [marine sediment metagenome]|uniref:TM7S3/TM198-like domain-containing protein n=1 Tax=marine sediment metagenome TaxID=412755 RepID=A0A0F9Z2T6_9ZZZZ|nr:DUF4203 domain-containing protein [Phycisphaerae bacterium]HDZ44244.1 DUF4203 domain-containing protein [Phycisphaerae bacterium]
MMAMALHPNNLFTLDLHAVVLVVMILWGLATCLLGYPLFRVVLVVYGVLAGVAGGIDLVGAIRENPSIVACVVAAAVLGVLGGLIAWRLCRLAFALVMAWMAMALAAWLVGWVTGAPDRRVVWVIGGLVGAGVGLLAYHYLRSVIIFATGLSGGVMTVYAAALLVHGIHNGEGLKEALLGPKGHPWVGFLLLLVAAGLTGVGMAVQSKLADVVGHTFMPSQRGPRRGSKGDRLSAVRPRFTRS